jgi:hypothetical protein
MGKAKAAPPADRSAPQVTNKALHNVDLEEFVLPTGFGSPSADLRAIVSLAANHPRVALMAARRMLVTLDGVTTPNDRLEVLAHLPPALATYVGIQPTWVDLAPKISLSTYAMETGRLVERALFGYPALSWNHEWPTGPRWPGYYQSSMTTLLHVLAVASRLEALPPTVTAVRSFTAAAAAKAALAASSAVPGWHSEQQTLATAGVECQEYDENAAASSVAVPSSTHHAAAASFFAAIVDAAGGGSGVWATPTKTASAATAADSAPAVPVAEPTSRPPVPSFSVDPVSLSQPTGGGVTMAEADEPPAAALAALATATAVTYGPATADAPSDALSASLSMHWVTQQGIPSIASSVFAGKGESEADEIALTTDSLVLDAARCVRERGEEVSRVLKVEAEAGAHTDQVDSDLALATARLNSILTLQAIDSSATADPAPWSTLVADVRPEAARSVYYSAHGATVLSAARVRRSGHEAGA